MGSGGLWPPCSGRLEPKWSISRRGTWAKGGSVVEGYMVDCSVLGCKMEASLITLETKQGWWVDGLANPSVCTARGWTVMLQGGLEAEWGLEFFTL